MIDGKKLLKRLRAKAEVLEAMSESENMPLSSKQIARHTLYGVLDCIDILQDEINESELPE